MRSIRYPAYSNARKNQQKYFYQFSRQLYVTALYQNTSDCMIRTYGNRNEIYSMTISGIRI